MADAAALVLYQDHFHLKKKAAIFYSNTCTSGAKEILKRNTQGIKVMLQSLQRKENWGRICPFLSNCKPQSSVHSGRLGQQQFTPVSSMRVRAMGFLSETVEPSRDGYIAITQKTLVKCILRSLAVVHLCWSAMERQSLKKGIVYQYRRYCASFLFLLTTILRYNLLKSKHKFRCVVSTERHSKHHFFAEEKEIQIQEFSLIQVNIF